MLGISTTVCNLLGVAFPLGGGVGWGGGAITPTENLSFFTLAGRAMSREVIHQPLTAESLNPLALELDI